MKLDREDEVKEIIAQVASRKADILRPQRQERRIGMEWSENEQRDRVERTVAFIEGLNYRRRRLFLWHRVRPQYPRFLYKFRPLVASDSGSVDRMRDILVRSRLWVSAPTDFNDPFDMSAQIIVEGTVQQKRDRLAGILKGQSMRWKEQARKLPTMVAKSNEELAQMAQRSYQQTVTATGVYCFGGDPRSILMWSHYAADHEGLCLQFETARDPRSFLMALPVKYSKEYPILNWITDIPTGSMRALLRKYSEWEHEKERRILILEQAHTFLPFRAEALTGIIVGCRAKEATIARLRQLLSERAAASYPLPRLYRAIQHVSKYKLIIRSFD